MGGDEYDMEITPERSRRIKAELQKQYEDQAGQRLVITAVSPKEAPEEM